MDASGMTQKLYVRVKEPVVMVYMLATWRGMVVVARLNSHSTK